MIKPRPYQLEAVKKSRKALKATKRALVVMATGMGKMITSALVWHRFARGKGLFLVHTNGILDVAVEEYRKVFGTEAKFGYFNGRSKDVEGADIVFATFQSMTHNLSRFRPDQFGWMTVDETHHSQAESYRPVIEHFSCPRLGITATPNRADLLDIRTIFGEEVVNIPLEEAIAKNWLPRIEYHLVADHGFDEEALQRLTKEVVNDGRRISLEEINRRVFIRARDEKVGKIIEGYNEKTVVFCHSIEHTKNFKKFLKFAEVYHSKQSVDENRKVLENLHRGTTRRVLAVNAFNEGINVPDVGLVVFYRATQSETIFRQQLGRGLRPGKEKLVVLDFVGNIERIQMLRKMTGTIESLVCGPKGGEGGYVRDQFHLSGKGFEFTFADKIVDLIKVIDMVNVNFYPTWQEASKACKRLQIKTCLEYKKKYRLDPRLPGYPNGPYRDFPGWKKFLGRHYATWQEASKAAKKLGFTTQGEYYAGFRRDPALKGKPGTYRGWPGWHVFLGKEKRKTPYQNWQEAARAMRRLGIKSQKEYAKRYREDPHLPADLYRYPGFPGLDRIMHNRKEPYPTWQEASRAAKRLGLKIPKVYRSNYKRDHRLVASPERDYADFPGWPMFLRGEIKTKKKFYPSWKQASMAAQKLGIKGQAHYKSFYKKDAQLPSNPQKVYRDFPGYTVFLGL